MAASLSGMGSQFSAPAWWFKENATSKEVYLEFPTRGSVRGMLVSLDNRTWSPVDNAFLRRLPETEDARTTWIDHISSAAPDVHFSTSNRMVVSDRVECWKGYIQFYASCSRIWYPVADLPMLY
jgi:hypothetical protein